MRFSTSGWFFNVELIPATERRSFLTLNFVSNSPFVQNFQQFRVDNAQLSVVTETGEWTTARRYSNSKWATAWKIGNLDESELVKPHNMVWRVAENLVRLSLRRLQNLPCGKRHHFGVKTYGICTTGMKKSEYGKWQLIFFWGDRVL
jgi:hypothetical protein